MNKKNRLLLIPTLLLVGCSNNNLVSNSSQLELNQSEQKSTIITITDLSSIHWQTLALPTQARFTLIDKQQATTQNQDNNDFITHNQQLINDESAGTVAAFTIPADRGAINISLKSYAKHSLYAPNIKVFNQDNQLVAQKSFKEFNYHPSQLFENNVFETTLSVLPRFSDQEFRILIFTTADDLKTTSTLLHPAKAFAIKKNTVPPTIADPTVPHVTHGELYIELTPANITSRYIPASATNDHVPLINETQDYYTNAINESVKAGDIDKAMRLLDEAEKLGIKDARENFINAVKQRP